MKTSAKINTDFALKFYRKLKNVAFQENIAFSPIALSFSMALIHMGSRGSTRKQIEEAFNFDDTGNGSYFLYQNYKYFRSVFNNPSHNCSFSILNKLYGNTGYGYKQSFINDSRQLFDTEFEEVDFIKSAQKVRCNINSWVTNVTDHRLPEFLPVNVITPSTVLLLLNLVYFNGVWHHPFNYHKTSKGKFYINANKVTQMHMMKTKKYFNYADVSERYRYRILEMPYVGEKVSMYILLPDNINGLNFIEDKLSHSDFEEVLENKLKSTLLMYPFHAFKFANISILDLYLVLWELLIFFYPVLQI